MLFVIIRVENKAIVSKEKIFWMGYFTVIEKEKLIFWLIDISI